MEAVGGGSVMSPVLQALFERLEPNQNFIQVLFPGSRKLQLKRLMRVLQLVSGVLEDAENKQGRSPAVKTWFNGLKHAVYQADDVLDEINTERVRINTELCIGNYLQGYTDFSDQFIGELSPRLEEICDALEIKVQRIGVLGLRILHGKQKREDRLPSTSVVEQSHIFGRDVEKEKIIQMVLSGEGAIDVSVIPITGMGGVGKTTLAQLVYNDERVKNHFETQAWVCVSEEFDVKRVTKDLLKQVNSSVVVDEKDDLNRLQAKLTDNLEGRHFIIILDDIWNENYDDCLRLMTPLNSGSRGTKIIVTTRNENIALMLQNEPFHYLHPIPEDHSWSLFKLHASNNRARPLSHEFETIGKKLVEKCKGLPLAIKTIAGALCSKSGIREWHDMLSSHNWMDVGDILPALSLSYKFLPSHLKCCFAFCAVFPKDYLYYKAKVARLWMANDLVRPSIQKVAENYFEELRSRYFFEKRENCNNYLMHDLFNDLARYVSGNFCAKMEDYQSKDLHRGIQGENNLPPEVLHFSYLSPGGGDTSKRFRGLAKVQGLRTFLPIHTSKGDYITTLFFTDTLPKLRHIRALSLNDYHISEIPHLIGDLKHLRLLNLASTDIKKLPNDITKCLNLQTLILENCSKLEELPEDMGLLINLQHIDVRGVGFNLFHKMESWLSKLKDIQNLSILVDGIHGSAFEQFDKLQLDRFLKFFELDDALTVEMAKSVELKNKNWIKGLMLVWSSSPESLHHKLDLFSECSEDELNIFSELIPHTNIQFLSIWYYRGAEFSNWLGDSSFCNIEDLNLKDCKNSSHLPPLGQLTGLKSLKISGMDGITMVGEEFYGNSSICKPFQVLEKLTFSNMAEWTTWNTHPDNADFLSLKEFKIKNCPKLVGDIPLHLTSLTTLRMNGLYSLHLNQEGSLLSSSLQEAKSSNLLRFNKMTQGIESLEISDCPTIFLSLQSCCDLKRLVMDDYNHFELPTDESCGELIEAIPLFSFSKLQQLQIRHWETPNLFKFPNGNHQSFTSLQSLKIHHCNNILSFPKGGLPAPNLTEFEVSDCNNMKSLPEQMHTQLSSLLNLRIFNCPKMEGFPDGGFPPSLEYLEIEGCRMLVMFPRNWGLQRLPSLELLTIWDIEDKLFPEEGWLPASLQNLLLCDCPNLEALNHKGLQDITSLDELLIYGCPNLRYLPEDGLPSSLSKLDILDCPKLKVRIEREKGEDWSKISHIPCIIVDEEIIS